MAIYSMIFLGTTPVGAPIVGWVGEVFGARWSLGVGAIASILIAAGAAAWGFFYWNIRLRVNPVTRHLNIVTPEDEEEGSQ